MKWMYSGGLCLTAVVVLGIVAFAQPTSQQVKVIAPQTLAAAQTSAAPAQQITMVGCIQREADYRKARDAGKGGAAGTGVGAGNEFVLINASAAPAGPGAGAAGTSGTAIGTAGVAANVAYELTGANEGQAEKFVGKRVEIAGMLKSADTAGSAPTGGPTAGAPPRGVDVMSEDLKLREIEVSSVKETTGSCSAS